jgi:alkylation response protein AidB-like acyl-CoA dehydrogenase/acyl carrier protein
MDLAQIVSASAASTLGVEDQTIDAATSLRDVSTFSSFRAIELVESLEEQLGIEIPPEELTMPNLSSVPLLVDVCARALGRAQPAPQEPIAPDPSLPRREPRTIAERRPSAPDALERCCAAAREHAVSTDEQARFPVETVDVMRDTGLLGWTVPVEYGGAGRSLRDMLDVTSTLSRECMSVGMIFAMHCQQVAGVVEHGSDQLRDEVLPEVADGRMYLASVTTDAGSGGSLLASASELTEAAGILHLDRMAPIVTGGAYADGFLITTLAPDASSPNEVSLVFARRDQLDVQGIGGWDPLGMRATHSIPMKLVGEIPASQTVGIPGRFRDIVVKTFGPLAHLGWAASWLGTADGAQSRVIRHLRDSRADGKLGSELLARRLSRVRQRSDIVHALISQAVDALARGTQPVSSPPMQLLLNGVKITASEQCYAIVDELIELVGLRHGYLRNSPLALERALRDLRSCSLNFSNDRLHASNGSLALMDQAVRHVDAA